MTAHQEWDAARSRQACYDRQGGLCALCWKSLGGPEGSWEAHHRLRRRDLPGWCPCNIVALHARCHTQGHQAVHDHPERARALGLILATSDDPRDVPLPVWKFLLEGPVYLDCDSMVVSSLIEHTPVVAD